MVVFSAATGHKYIWAYRLKESICSNGDVKIKVSNELNKKRHWNLVAFLKISRKKLIEAIINSSLVGVL